MLPDATLASGKKLVGVFVGCCEKDGIEA